MRALLIRNFEALQLFSVSWQVEIKNIEILWFFNLIMFLDQMRQICKYFTELREIICILLSNRSYFRYFRSATYYRGVWLLYDIVLAGITRVFVSLLEASSGLSESED